MSITAAYLRVSSDNQDVARQRAAIEDWAERQDLEIAHWFEDSEGRNPRDQASKRVGFQNLLESVRAGMLNKIIVESQDRFGTRDAYQLGEFLTLLRDNDCELWSVQQGHLTADDDATILTNTIGALTSTREQKEKAARNVGGKVQKAKVGEYQGGYPAYGMCVACFNGKEKWRVEWVGHYERWKIYPDGSREAFNGKDNFPAKDANDTLRYRPTHESERLDIVRSMFNWFANEDLSAGQIATRLNSMGITTTVGTPWNKQIVKPLLKNPVYLGLPAWNKRAASRFKEYVDGQIQDVDKKTAGRTRSTADYVQPEVAEFEPIIDRETWDKVQAKFEANKTGKRAPAQVSELWLKPFLFCGKCMKPMRAAKPQPRMDYGSYFCGTYGTYGKDNPTGCRCHRVKHDVIEAVVDKYLEEIGEPLTTLAECEDSALFDMTYREWAKATRKKNLLWARMAEGVTDWEGEDWWNIDKHYEPSDTPELIAEIDAKESELDDMLAGFFKLSPALQDRANERMEALQAEIDALREQIEDLSTPWQDACKNARKRIEAVRFASSLSDETGPRKAEALRSVIDKIICHYRYTEKKSFIETIEIVPVSGDSVCFTEETSPGQGSRRHDCQDG